MLGGLVCFQHRTAPTNTSNNPTKNTKGGKFSRLKATGLGYCRLQNAGRKLASYVTVAGDTFTGTATVWSGHTEQKTGTINESPYLEDDGLSIGETSQWTNTQNNDDHDGLNDPSYGAVDTEDNEISAGDALHYDHDALYTPDDNTTGFQSQDEDQYIQQSTGLDDPYSNQTTSLDSPDENDIEAVHVTQSLLEADYIHSPGLDSPFEQPNTLEANSNNDVTPQSRNDESQTKNAGDEYTPVSVGDLIKRFSSKRQER